MKTIQSVTLTEDVTLVVLSNTPSDIRFVSRVFDALSQAGVNVDMISQSPAVGDRGSLSFTISGEQLTPALMVIARLRESDPAIQLSISSDNCKIAVIGEEMRNQPGVAADVFRAAAAVHADLRMITTSEVDISLLVTKADAPGALAAIEKTFA